MAFRCGVMYSSQWRTNRELYKEAVDFGLAAVLALYIDPSGFALPVTAIPVINVLAEGFRGLKAKRKVDRAKDIFAQQPVIKADKLELKV